MESQDWIDVELGGFRLTIRNVNIQLAPHKFGNITGFRLTIRNVN